MFSLTLCIRESVICSECRKHVPAEKRAVVPKNIHFNGVHGTKTIGMPIGSNRVHEERASTPALSEVGVRILLVVPGSRRSEFVPLPRTPALVANTSYFSQQMGCKGSPVPFAQHTFGWWCGGGRAALEQICLCCWIQKLIEIPTLGLCLTALS